MTSAAPTASALPEEPVKIIHAEPSSEPVQSVVKREREAHRGRDLLIYVGAEWCEPCERFKRAAKRGQLDRAFSNLVLLEFDRDVDEARLAAAGCITKLIPLFARPLPDGRCDLARAVTGSIKGPKSVAGLTKRLQTMLAK